MNTFQDLIYSEMKVWKETHRLVEAMRARLRPPQNEFSAFFQVDIVEQFVFRCIRETGQILQSQFEFDVQEFQFSVEARRRILNDVRFRLAACDAMLAFNAARHQLGIAVLTQSEGKEQHWSTCHIFMILFERLLNLPLDLPILDYNILRRFGRHERAFVQILGATAWNRKIPKRHKTTRLLEGQPPPQAYTTLLLESLSNLPHDTEGKYPRLKLEELPISDWTGELWRSAENRLNQQLAPLRHETSDFPILDGEAAIGTYIENQAGGIDPYEEFMAKQNLEAIGDHFWQVFENLSPQQQKYVLLQYQNPEISLEEIAGRMGKTRQDINNIRARIRAKFEDHGEKN